MYACVGEVYPLRIDKVSNILNNFLLSDRGEARRKYFRDRLQIVDSEENNKK